MIGRDLGHYTVVEALGAVPRLLDDMPRLEQHGRQQIAQLDVVVYDEHTPWHGVLRGHAA